MRTFSHLLLAIATMSFFTGCREIATIHNSELIEMVERSRTGNFPSEVFYCGSDAGFDYFMVTQVGSSIHRRIASAETPLQKRFPLTRDHGLWMAYEPRSGLPLAEYQKAVENHFSKTK